MQTINNTFDKAVSLAMQMIKFCAVGLINTAITLLTIYFLYQFCHINYIAANMIGFLLGFINSFFMNKHWTFNSDGTVLTESLFFIIVFIISYLIQLKCYLLFNETFKMTAPISQLIAMVVYTAVNFLGNKIITFRHGRG